ncbi:hypothetical protein CC86DRAFT_35712 [Ophiobolus disseminans]|uniref:Uncharacterized protein n=1 Tax=Ophiobolus disseminans TaxID=1469910 RepID=A0A6A6ZY97_9PLEO|nr:hypothetical protein CC86DRAFT_35712 [Ophiobolus disseminans]
MAARRTFHQLSKEIIKLTSRKQKTFQLGVIITILYSIFTLAHPSTSFLPIIPIALLTTATTLYLILGFVRHALATLSGDHLPSTVAGVVQPYNPNVPVSPLAFNILNVLSTFAALYVSLVVLFNIEVLLLLPLVLKQRAYSYLHKELGTPVVGPVFMTQMCRSAFKFLDDMFTPWTAARGVRNGIGGVVGEQVVAGTAQSEGFVVAVKWLLRMR